MNDIIQQVSVQLGINETQTTSVLKLLEDGNTVPFIARYRKEMTGALTEDQIREISKHYDYQVSLMKRKEDVIRLIDEKGMLTPELEREIEACIKLVDIDDLYRPFKEKKKTRATEAISKGLEPLAKWILGLPTNGNISQEASKYVNDSVKTEVDAINGALDIIAESVSDNPKFRRYIKEFTYKLGVIKSKEKKKHADESKVYEMYYQYEEKVCHIVSHRILAINRAESEKVVSVTIEIDPTKFFEYMYRGVTRNKDTIVDLEIRTAIEDAYKRLIAPSIEREIRNELTDKAEDQALVVFSTNLEKLLLQAPLKDKMVLGVDPAYRTGCKLAVVDATGKMLAIDKIYPTLPKNDYSQDIKKVLSLINTYNIEIIAIGNGTASRETESFIADVIKNNNLNISYVIVSEAGASVYSASKIAKDEFPGLVVEERSAISIARRLQDPLAELVKIEPKAISVGQYQHDMNQSKLSEQLDYVVMKTVNRVGVNINTASASLLQYVAGLSESVAKSIVSFRDKMGKFSNREQIKMVPKLGPKTFEQSVGFLRVIDGDEVLDKTSIHPESYKLAYKLLEDMGLTSKDISSTEIMNHINLLNKEEVCKKYKVDMYTLDDILDSFISPNRSPRDEYQTPILRKDVLKIDDLSVGMELQGTVRNVVDFGAFVDIGIKNDGLVHISKICNEFIKHPLEKLNVGDIVKVFVEGVDLNKGKVSLTMLRK